MFKLVAMTVNEVVEREATFSHMDDAKWTAERWYDLGHDVVRLFETGDGTLVNEWRDVA